MSSLGDILVIDDEPNALKVISAILSESGYDVEAVMDVDDACQAVDARDFDAVVTDMKLPDGTGMDIFHYVKEKRPDIPVIFLTAYGTVESAVDAMTGGAFYYFIKPPDYVNLKGILSRAVEQRRLKRELSQLRQRLARGKETSRIIGNHPSILRIQEVVEAVSDSESSVLIRGETGTGKELTARAIHRLSARADKPLVTVNCTTLTDSLLESELFGHKKGAFTGAIADRKGLFEAADGGTIFLDEIGDITPKLQAELLRLLDVGEVRPVGGTMAKRVDVRLIAATNKDLEAGVREGWFREDLYYRLNVFAIQLPPLRDREDSIPILARHFLGKARKKLNKSLSGIEERALTAMRHYRWPGNIREMQNIIERAAVLSQDSVIRLENLPSIFREIHVERAGALPGVRRTSFKAERETHLGRLERNLILRYLEESGGNVSKAARLAEVPRRTFYRLLERYAITIQRSPDKPLAPAGDPAERHVLE